MPEDRHILQRCRRVRRELRALGTHRHRRRSCRGRRPAAEPKDVRRHAHVTCRRGKPAVRTDCQRIRQRVRQADGGGATRLVGGCAVDVPATRNPVVPSSTHQHSVAPPPRERGQRLRVPRPTAAERHHEHAGAAKVQRLEHRPKRRREIQPAFVALRYRLQRQPCRRSHAAVRSGVEARQQPRPCGVRGPRCRRLCVEAPRHGGAHCGAVPVLACVVVVDGTEVVAEVGNLAVAADRHVLRQPNADAPRRAAVEKRFVEVVQARVEDGNYLALARQRRRVLREGVPQTLAGYASLHVACRVSQGSGRAAELCNGKGEGEEQSERRRRRRPAPCVCHVLGRVGSAARRVDTRPRAWRRAGAKTKLSSFRQGRHSWARQHTGRRQ
eukprot:Rhum_TRINITY_DN12634_c0_g1::Rhum_TRINITY_DN12634_c0_g1_i1::g.53343::m.53343